MLDLILLALIMSPGPHGVPVRRLPPATQSRKAPGTSPASEKADLDAIGVALAARHFDQAATLILAFRVAHPAKEPDRLRVYDAELKLARGDAVGAAEEIGDLQPVAPFRCEVLQIRGHAAVARENADRAIENLGTFATSCDPDDSDWDALGRALARAGEQQASDYAFAQALAHTNDARSVRNHYGEALLGLGKRDAAADQFALVLRDDPSNREAREALDQIGGMEGREPVRGNSDGDEAWANRLVSAARGADRAGRAELARSLFARAAIASPYHDARLFEEAKAK